MIWPRSLNELSKPSLLLSLCSSSRLRDDLALEILPGAVADAVACVDGRLAGGLLGAQIGAPGLDVQAKLAQGPNGDEIEYDSQQATERQAQPKSDAGP